MTQGFSFYLNLLRFAAAFVVLLSHFAYERFTRGTIFLFDNGTWGATRSLSSS